jgi:hypothetical protein
VYNVIETVEMCEQKLMGRKEIDGQHGAWQGG